VPSVVGDSQQTASQVLTTAGFQVNVQQGSGPASFANGTVFQQNPAANGSATKGATVTIFVQTGQSPSAPPTDTATPTVTPSGPADGTGILNLNQ
jgi:beta-lactam-binding protein with PASTA domain